MKTLCLLAALLFTGLLAAQDAPADAPDAAVARELTPAHRAAAEAVLEANDTQRSIARSMETMLDAQLRQNPALEPFDDVLRTFLRKHLTYANMKEELILTYCEFFTREELEAIAAFYRTPVGKKLARTTPELTARGARIGERLMQRHAPELQAAINARIAELQAAGKLPDHAHEHPAGTPEPPAPPPPPGERP